MYHNTDETHNEWSDGENTDDTGDVKDIGNTVNTGDSWIVDTVSIW